jgi:hypothetical protein
MKLKAWFSFVVPGTGLLLLGCGGGSVPKPPAPVGSALAGNWLLVGPMPTDVFALESPAGFRLAMTFDVNGKNVIAAGSGNNSCGGGGESFGFASLTTGTINEDGSFTLQTPTNFPLGTISINGKVPEASGASWPGSYTASFSTPVLGPVAQTCETNLTGTFTATPFPLVSGVYAGTGSSQTGLNGVPTTISIEVSLQQGGTVTIPATGLPFSSNSVLTGSIRVKGSPCFTSGVTSSAPLSAVEGNEVVAVFTMDDGSTVELQGTLADPTEATILTNVLLVPAGPCGRAPYVYQLRELDRQG